MPSHPAFDPRMSWHKLHSRSFAGDVGGANLSRWDETISMVAEDDTRMMLQA